MPMGEYAWKLRNEKKNAEAAEMEDIEKELNAIYKGMDPKQIGWMTTAKPIEGGPEKGALLMYEERKRLTGGNPPESKEDKLITGEDLSGKQPEDNKEETSLKVAKQ
ncbi:hypothetical protein CYMTET_26696 [Cymbomonas tetramitiformis]|uniref:Uncharacterized protein n=1 Tax=Cymbomonas tetramitiformis TaxID=36881 RepID=A0AAE0FRZ7_9CHLO|nr:hypothetical protein CYMTET_26696 [Cymbomonas tetramitiformis]